jgi:hypothetical protein
MMPQGGNQVVISNGNQESALQKSRKVFIAKAGRKAPLQVIFRSMKRPSRILALSLSVVFLGILAMLVAMPLAGQSKASSERLILSGDIVYFFGPGKPRNCTMSNRYKRGEPVGFRMTAINPATGKRDRATQLVLHLNYGGKTYDLPMRDRQTVQQPEREFWVLKWIVPEDAPTGIVRYSVTAKDSEGRTGEWKPFDVEASQLTIVDE